MPKKGGKKGKGKAKVLDWGEIVREQYVTIEVCHAALRCCTAASSFESSSTRVWPRWQMRNAKWHSMCFKHTMAVSEPVPASPRAPSQHRLRRTPAWPQPHANHPSLEPPQPRAIPAAHEPARPPPHPTSRRTPARQLGRRRMPAQPPPHARLAAARMPAEQRDPRGCRWTRCAACSWSSTGWAAARA